MTVNTSKVEGRRDIRYESLEDVFADARRCADGGWTTNGNWSISQIYHHLSVALHAGIDGVGFRIFWPKRLLARVFLKKKYLAEGIPPGFKIPGRMKQLEPTEMPIEDALAQLANAIERYQGNPKRAPHPLFGQFTDEESDQFQLRHAELHMSFIVPAEDK
ncbi:MAG: DUF1569 domain-containing protein [Planctomycetota bacterium]|nr:DUF1569 domain-containing protein [Planctomycetota bacterium]